MGSRLELVRPGGPVVLDANFAVGFDFAQDVKPGADAGAVVPQWRELPAECGDPLLQAFEQLGIEHIAKEQLARWFLEAQPSDQAEWVAFCIEASPR